ncbi:hypothetical protein E2542_SST07890 [Spatholobus suberectus]|nr:hypothetical protein E2542_SST07890 [Spatholobus suberectus]
MVNARVADLEAVAGIKRFPDKQKEGEFCATNPSTDDHSNVPIWMDETFNVAYASLETPLQVDHPSNIMSLNTSTTQSEWYWPQMTSTVMPLVWPQIPQATLRMPPIRPSPIRPPMRIESQVLNASQIGSDKITNVKKLQQEINSHFESFLSLSAASLLGFAACAKAGGLRG